MLPAVFKPFIEESPISIMARGMIERVLSPEQLNQWFDTTANNQYTKDLLFSSLFDIMSLVVHGRHRSVHAAYQASKQDICVSIASVYNKLNGIESETSAQLVRYAAGQAAAIIEKLGGTNPDLLPGLRVKLLDGNCIEKSHHRIKELRSLAAGPLPGKSLVVYDPAMRLPIDVFPCEDGHSQERSLLNDVLSTIEPKDAWIADRNFCTLDFTCSIASKKAYFIIREHKKYPYQLLGKQKHIGKTETGKVYEQAILVIDSDGQEHTFRRIRLSLKKNTRDGDSDIFIICNLSKTKADAKKIAELYRGRWTIETAFQHLADYFNSEINALGYPRAALFGFCVALVSYIILSVIKSAMSSVHGANVVENEISGYYLADELSATYRGMLIAISEENWVVFRQMTPHKFSTILKRLAAKMKLYRFQKHPRGPKKPQPKRKSSKNTPHVSTAQIIAQRKK
jgi:hypothetical protein